MRHWWSELPPVMTLVRPGWLLSLLIGSHSALFPIRQPMKESLEIVFAVAAYYYWSLDIVGNGLKYWVIRCCWFCMARRKFLAAWIRSSTVDFRPAVVHWVRSCILIGIKENIVCWYGRLILIFAYRRSTSYHGYLRWFVGCCCWSLRCFPQNCQSLLLSTLYF